MGGTDRGAGEGCVETVHCFSPFEYTKQARNGTSPGLERPKTHSIECPLPEDLLLTLKTKGIHCRQAWSSRALFLDSRQLQGPDRALMEA